jgi:hypothetical protein
MYKAAFNAARNRVPGKKVLKKQYFATLLSRGFFAFEGLFSATSALIFCFPGPNVGMVVIVVPANAICEPDVPVG